jgi:hypothetical protein
VREQHSSAFDDEPVRGDTDVHPMTLMKIHGRGMSGAVPVTHWIA